MHRLEFYMIHKSDKDSNEVQSRGCGLVGSTLVDFLYDLSSNPAEVYLQGFCKIFQKFLKETKSTSSVPLYC